jgi:hypothetical protein
MASLMRGGFAELLIALLAGWSLTAAAQEKSGGGGESALTGVDSVRQRVASGQYQDALRLISQQLTRTARDKDNPDRYDLLMLKGESLLQLGQRASAGDAFDQAAKAAPDIRGTALARANALLVRSAPNNKYKPKSGGASAQPIDILNPESRKQAFAALREDKLAALAPKLKKAEDAKSLPPMIDVLPAVLDCGYLEGASSGAAPQTRAALAEMGAHARDLMTAELRRLRYRVDQMEDLANSFINDDLTRRGLFSNERQELTDDIAYLKQIEQTARDARRRARELGFDGAAWEPIAADAADLADRAQALNDIGGRP